MQFSFTNNTAHVSCRHSFILLHIHPDKGVCSQDVMMLYRRRVGSRHLVSIVNFDHIVTIGLNFLEGPYYYPHATPQLISHTTYHIINYFPLLIFMSDSWAGHVHSGTNSTKERSDILLYTSSKGYHMKIGVDPSGYGAGKGTHISVFAMALDGPVPIFFPCREMSTLRETCVKHAHLDP